MPLRSERSNEQHSCQRIRHLVEHGIKILPRHFAVCGVLDESVFDMNLSFQRAPLSPPFLGSDLLSAAIDDGLDERAKQIHTLK